MGACLSAPAQAEGPAPVPTVEPSAADPAAPAQPQQPPQQQQEQQQQQQQQQEPAQQQGAPQVAQFPVMTVQDAPVRPPWASRSPADAMADGSIPPPLGVGVRQPGRSTTAEAVRMNTTLPGPIARAHKHEREWGRAAVAAATVPSVHGC